MAEKVSHVTDPYKSSTTDASRMVDLLKDPVGVSSKVTRKKTKKKTSSVKTEETSQAGTSVSEAKPAKHKNKSFADLVSVIAKYQEWTLVTKTEEINDQKL